MAGPGCRITAPCACRPAQHGLAVPRGRLPGTTASSSLTPVRLRGLRRLRTYYEPAARQRKRALMQEAVRRLPHTLLALLRAALVTAGGPERRA